MGCHTWFLKPIKKPNFSLEELKKEILNYIDNDSIPFYEKELLKEDNSNYSKEELKNDLNWIIEHKETIKKSNNENFLLESYYGFKVINFTFYNNKFYEDAGYYDIFRHRNYEAPTLTSLEMTLNFINEHNCKGISYMNENGKIVQQEIDFKLLNEFWNKHPDGIIEFG